MTFENLRKRNLQLRLDIERHFVEAEAWNSANPKDQPIDPDPDGRLAAIYLNLCETMMNTEWQMWHVFNRELSVRRERFAQWKADNHVEFKGTQVDKINLPRYWKQKSKKAVELGVLD